jgi:RNA polymerase sigma-70 factor (ECF subfamily)
VERRKRVFREVIARALSINAQEAYSAGMYKYITLPRQNGFHNSVTTSRRSALYDGLMKVTHDAFGDHKSPFPEDVRWDVQSAVVGLAATEANELPDNLLMTLLLSAEDQATFNRFFEEVFRRYKERVEKWCYKVAKNRERALDLTQEVFLKVFRSIHTFHGDSQLSTWLYVITRNHCLNALKKWKTEPDEQALRPRVLLVYTGGEDAQSTLERTQSFQQVLRFLHSILTPMEVRVLTLHYVHDLTLPAITRRLMLSNPSGAKAYAVSARRKLKVLVQNYNNVDTKRTDASEFLAAANRTTAA